MSDVLGRSSLRKLKSGSDIRGLAIGSGDAPATLTAEIGVAVGRAFVSWLASRVGKDARALRIAVGRDSRLTGEALAKAMAEGLCDAGAQVLDCGLCTTPAMFMTTMLEACDGAVMVTASHMPSQFNGYKFVTKDGGLAGQDVLDILDSAANKPECAQAGSIVPCDFLSQYCGFLSEKIQGALGEDAPLAGLHVVVDAGNGAGGFYADLLSSLGADISGSQFLAPDGTFPNHIPNPEAEAAMESISKATVRAAADFGVIFDADCDRAALVDARGIAINRNRLIALTAAILLRETPGVTVVTDSVTSSGLDAFLTEQGGVLHRYKRGYRNVIDEAKRLNDAGVDCPLAMETSGHAAMRENYFLDDGMYLVTRLIIEAMRCKREGTHLGALIEALPEPVESIEKRLTIQSPEYRDIGMRLIDRVSKLDGFTVDPKGREGIRMLHGSAQNWFLLRLSLHEPLLVLNAESDTAGGTQAMLDALRPVIAEFSEVAQP